MQVGNTITGARAVVPRAAPGAPGGSLALVRPRDPLAALARAVEICARHDAFGAQPFGRWSRVLIGQANRGHCRFVVERRADATRIVGFAGWFRAGADAAARWLADDADPRDDPDGDHVVVNAVVAVAPAVLRFLTANLDALGTPPFTLIAKRAYADARVRPVRLRVTRPSPPAPRPTSRSRAVATPPRRCGLNHDRRET